MSKKLLLFAFFCPLIACATGQPEWVKYPPQDDETIWYFTSYIETAFSHATAEESAEIAVRKKIAETVMSHIRTDSQLESDDKEWGADGSVHDAFYERYTQRTVSSSEVRLSGIKIETYVEKFGKRGQEEYHAWAYTGVPVAQIDQLIAEAASFLEQVRQLQAHPLEASFVVNVLGEAASMLTEVQLENIHQTARASVSRALQEAGSPLRLSVEPSSSAHNILTVTFDIRYYPPSIYNHQTSSYGAGCMLRLERGGVIVTQSRRETWNHIDIATLFNAGLSRALTKERDFFYELNKALYSGSIPRERT